MQIPPASIVLVVVILCVTLLTTEVASFRDYRIASDKYDDVNMESPGQGRAPSIQELEDALKKAREINLLEREVRMLDRKYDKGNKRGLKCPLSLHHGTRDHANSDAGSNANDAFLALRILRNENGYNGEDMENATTAENLKRIAGYKCNTPKAPSASECDVYKQYRTFDGSCNNKLHTDWGMAGSIQRRVRKNDYDDKISLPRTKGVAGKILPNARTISEIVHRNIAPSGPAIVTERLTLHTMAFGQLLDHDIAQTPEISDVDDCCEASARKRSDLCFNVIIPPKVSYLKPTSKILKPGHCMEVKRSDPVLCKDETSVIPIRQQTTRLTSFVDASNVYGSSLKRSKELREDGKNKKGKGYRLATDFFDNKERLLNGPDDTCVLTNSSQSCSAAGDIRVNEVSSLSSYHFLFVKEHNRIADVIKDHYKKNETIFQETRRIVVAIMQKIVYDEFLRSIFSKKGYKKFQLQTSAKYVYEPKTNPTMLNAFGIAYRVGHTWIPQRMRLFNRQFKQIKRAGFNRRTERTFHNPDLTYQPNAYPRLAYYLSGTQSPDTDRFVEEAVRSRLFIDEEANIAFDLAALNIQRAREHGLPSYNKYRNWCQLSSVDRSWNVGKSGLVDHSLLNIKKLKLAGYQSPRDIDLFTGGLTETNIKGGHFGPTFECILGRQFRRLKFGDRFWYQNIDAGFTKKQIAAIEKYSLAGMFCNNYDFQRIHVPVFLSSKLRSCKVIPDLDLTLFKPKDHSLRNEDAMTDREVGIEEELRDNGEVDEEIEEELRDNGEVDEEIEEELRDNGEVDEEIEEELRDNGEVDEEIEEELMDNGEVDEEIEEELRDNGEVDEEIEELRRLIEEAEEIERASEK